jgi:hypothetical protein
MHRSKVVTVFLCDPEHHRPAAHRVRWVMRRVAWSKLRWSRVHNGSTAVFRTVAQNGHKFIAARTLFVVLFCTHEMEPPPLSTTEESSKLFEAANDWLLDLPAVDEDRRDDRRQQWRAKNRDMEREHDRLKKQVMRVQLTGAASVEYKQRHAEYGRQRREREFYAKLVTMTPEKQAKAIEEHEKGVRRQLRRARAAKP